MSIDELVLSGRGQANLREALTGATLTRTMTGASTLQLTVRDPERALVRSELLAHRTTATVDPITFVLVQVRKAGSQLTATFEDQAVHRLRQRKGLIVAAAGSTTRAAFAKRLFDDAGVDSLVAPGPTAREQLSRGDEKKPDDEDSWTALRRLADQVHWRCFSLGRIGVFAPDSWLAQGRILGPGGSAPFELREHTGGVGDIDFDVDEGKPADTATAAITAARRWQLPPGAPARIRDLGAADGAWLIERVSGSLFSDQWQVSLTRRREPLPEPTGEPR